MKKRILIMISVMVLIAMVGCSQETIEVITTAQQPTMIVTITTTTTMPIMESKTTTITTTTEQKTTIKETTTSYKTTSKTKQQTTLPTTTKQKSTTQKAIMTTKKSNPTTTKRVITNKQETTTELKCTKSNHISYAGNMNKWFDSKAELKSYVDLTMRYWDEVESNGNITYDEYTKKCPYGYEAWTCAGCGMWTGNFKYL